MNEAEVKFEMRLWALELLVSNAFAMLCALDPQPDDLFAKIRQQMMEGARKRGFPGFDPGESDILSSELEAALGRLMEMVSTQMRHGRGTGGQ